MTSLQRKLWLPSLIAAANFLMLSCGNDRDSSNKKNPTESSKLYELIPNHNNSDMRLGSGYNSLSGDVKDRCIIDEQLPTQGPQVTTFSLRQLSSMEALQSALQVGASASFNSGYYRGSAQYSYFKNTNFNSFSSYLLVSVKVENQVKSLNEFKLKDEAARLLGENRAGFTKACGDEFISGMVTGGEFTALVEFYASSREEKERTEASLKASGGTWNVATDFKKSLESLSRTSNLSVEIFRKGSVGKVPRLDNLVEAALKFSEEVSGTEVPWIISWTTKPYADLLNYQRLGSAPSFKTQVALLEDAARITLLARTLKNDIAYVLSNATAFSLTEEKGLELSEADSKLATLINSYSLQANKCFAKPESDCVWPATTLPMVKLPAWSAPNSESIGNQKCAAARRRALLREQINEYIFERYEKWNLGPIHLVEGDLNSRITGWIRCHYVANDL